MLYACAVRFDVTKNFENFLLFGWTKQGLGCTIASHVPTCSPWWPCPRCHALPRAPFLRERHETHSLLSLVGSIYVRWSYNKLLFLALSHPILLWVEKKHLHEAFLKNGVWKKIARQVHTCLVPIRCKYALFEANRVEPQSKTKYPYHLVWKCHAK